MSRSLLRIGKGILTIAALIAVVLAVDPSSLLASIQQAKWLWVLAAIALLPVNLALETWVWSGLLRTVTDRASTREIFGAVMSGFTLGFWTPVQVGEYAARALYVKSGDRWSITLSVFAQRMVDMLIGVGLGGTVLVWALLTDTLPVSAPWMASAGIGAATVALLLVFVASPSRVHRMAELLLPPKSSVLERTAFFQRLSHRQVRSAVGGSVLRYLTFTGQFVCLSLAFNAAAPVGLLAAAVALTFYVKYLLPSLTMFDLGIREGSAVFFFQLLGLGGVAGLNAALLLFTVNLLLPALLGLPFLMNLPVSGEETESLDAPGKATLLPEW